MELPKKYFFRRSGNAGLPAYAPLKTALCGFFTGTCHDIGHTSPSGLGVYW